MAGRMRFSIVRRAAWVAGLVFSSAVAAQQPAAPTPSSVIPLWNGAAPGAQGTAQEDIPRLEVYLPPSPSSKMTAVVVCPGGAYHRQAMYEEGYPATRYFNALGVAVFVLRYRVGPKYHHPVELNDGLRAIRYVRANAAKWNLDPSHIGIMGFSAGGHLAATVSTHFDTGMTSASDPIDRVSSRPDFAVLVYPVISMDDKITHQGSKHNLLGDAPDSALVKSMSNELQVTAKTPQTFIFSGFIDHVVPVENSLEYFLALRKAGVLSELHVFQNGEHGTGMGEGDPVLSTWPPLLTNWLRENGWLARHS